MIDNAYVDVDSVDGPEGQPIVKAWLHLEGDFVTEADRYITSDDATTMVVELPRDAAEKLHESLTGILFG